MASERVLSACKIVCSLRDVAPCKHTCNPGLATSPLNNCVSLFAASYLASPHIHLTLEQMACCLPFSFIQHPYLFNGAVKLLPHISSFLFEHFFFVVVFSFFFPRASRCPPPCSLTAAAILRSGLVSGDCALMEHSHDNTV